MTKSKILILGGGRFGAAAAQKLAPSATLAVVDISFEKLEPLKKEGIETACAEGISFLAACDLSEYDWIVPAIPRHVAFEWLVCRAGIKRSGASLPGQFLLPNMMAGPPGTYYASLSKTICPDNCPEPENVCFVTGEQREKPMYRHLAEMPVPVHVVRSVQLAAGVGGISPSALREAENWVKGIRGGGIIATSCRCHAVLDFFQKN